MYHNVTTKKKTHQKHMFKKEKETNEKTTKVFIEKNIKQQRNYKRKEEQKRKHNNYLTV